MSNLKEKLTKGGVTAVIVITILAVCYGLTWIRQEEHTSELQSPEAIS